MADLTTKDKVKTYLGITSVTSDTAITSIVSSISSQIEVYCNRSFESTTYTQYFDTTEGYKKIFLKNYPVASLTSVQYRDGTWGNITWTNFNSSDYLLSESTGKLNFAYALPQAEKYVKVVYTGGYLIDFTNENDITKHTLPSALTQIATEMSAQTFNLSKSAGIQTESTEGQSISYQSSTNDSSFNSAKKRLDLFRNYNANF
jgi:hypothetical protein